MSAAAVVLTAALASGTTAVLKVPEGASAKNPLSAMVVFGGYEAGVKVLDPIKPKSPVVLATFEYPGPRKLRFPGSLFDAPEMKRAVAETPRRMVELAAYLRKQPYVDPKRVCVIGVSFAAPLAMRAAAEDPELSCVVIVEGFADVSGTAQARLAQQWRRKITPVLAWPLTYFLARPAIAYLHPPRPEEDALKLRATQRILVVDAEGDTLIPKRSRELLWDAIRASPAKSDRASVPGDHLTGVGDPRIPQIVSLVEKWLTAEGPEKSRTSPGK